MKLLQPGAAALAILILAGCGGGEDVPGQPSAEERRTLDNMAAQQDAEAAETFDTSADSLVPADDGAVAANGAAPANAAVANTTNTVSTGNSAAPR